MLQPLRETYYYINLGAYVIARDIAKLGVEFRLEIPCELTMWQMYSVRKGFGCGTYTAPQRPKSRRLNRSGIKGQRAQSDS